jgi:hypothetical protein
MALSAPPEVGSSSTTASSTIVYITSQNGQSIYDICVQTYGSLDLLYKLIQDNNFPNINTTLQPGTTLQWDSSQITDNSFYGYLQRNSLNIGTALTPEEQNAIVEQFLLQEDGDLILQEDEGGILI